VPKSIFGSIENIKSNVSKAVNSSRGRAAGVQQVAWDGTGVGINILKNDDQSTSKTGSAIDDKKMDVKISKVKKHYRVHTKKAEDFFDGISKVSFDLNGDIRGEESVPFQALMSGVISKTASAAYPTADAIRETLRVAYRNPKWPRAAVGGSLLGLASGAGGYYAGRAAQGESKDESWATKHPWLNWLGWGVIQSQTLPFTPISSVALGYGLGKRKRMEENNEMGKTASMNSPSKAAMIGLSMMVNR
jgi:hypothetical protein